MSSDERRRRGLLFVISSPSGAGKTTLSRRLLANHPDIMLSVSATTRPPRPGEVEGKDYFFLAEDDFKTRAREDYFYEWAKVHGFRYGTPREPVLETLEHGRDVLLDIDWQGAQQLILERDSDVVSVFILPPSMPELADRLKKRAQDTDEVIQTRLDGAWKEITHWAEYDYVLVNDDLDRTAADLEGILRSERLKRSRQPWLADFVRKLDPNRK
ncbi:MAG: guanylate kinase [Maricaulaceae bacterium]|jgi:guanylate kinase